MTTWNQRLAEAVADSGRSPNEIATCPRVRVAASSFAAWIGAANIKPASHIKAQNLFDVCRELGVRPEWVLYGELPKHSRDEWPFEISRAEFFRLPEEERALIQDFINHRAAKHQQVESGMGRRSRATELPSQLPKVSNKG